MSGLRAGLSDRRPPTTSPPCPDHMRLTQLAAETGLTLSGPDAEVLGVTHDSRSVRPGDLYVAIPGEIHDGAQFIAHALSAGATAVCATVPHPVLPTLLAPDPRWVLGHLSAAVYGHPSRQIRAIGLTGTLGKTSTALTLAHCLATAGTPAGVIGSLGIDIPGVDDWATDLTTPEAPIVQRALREMARNGVPHAVMEVSSHSLMLGRVEGVELAAGIFLNLVPDEHLDFHDTPEQYLNTKLRFLGLLRADAPLVHNGDDRLTRHAIESDAAARPAAERVGVSSRGAPDAAVRITVVPDGLRGSVLRLQILRELPVLGSSSGVLPGDLELRFPLIGAQLAWNAGIAATAALVAGCAPDSLALAFRTMPQIPRRMQLVRTQLPLVLDDTAGNPRSIQAVLHAVRGMPRSGVRVVYAVRGARGSRINRDNGVALAELVRELGAELVVTSSEGEEEGAADARNRVSESEREAVLGSLRAAGVAYSFEPRLHQAISRAVTGLDAEDLLLLLGAQGMDGGAELALGAISRAADTDSAPPGLMASQDRASGRA